MSEWINAWARKLHQRDMAGVYVTSVEEVIYLAHKDLPLLRAEILKLTTPEEPPL